jgi:hypothetical protein
MKIIQLACSLITLSLSLYAGTISEFKPGMHLKEFNQLNLCSNIKTKKAKMVRTSHGVVEKPSKKIRQIIKMSKTQEQRWESGIVEIKKNRLLSLSVYHHHADVEIASDIYHHIVAQLGQDFFPYSFKSFGKSAVAFEWSKSNITYTLKFSKQTDFRWACHFSIDDKKRTSNKTKLDLKSPKALAILNQILSKQPAYASISP